ncbi:MAG: hypothetical protein PSY12_12010 [bacterium]|nr:hypothetical protein [bacterium]
MPKQHVATTFELDDFDFEIAPGGCSEPVLHVPAVIVVVGAAVLLWPTPAR